jgi:glycosyltransferase involved in cell wall biosynthesis
LVVLVHMPLGHRGERAVLGAARAVATTSAWARRRVIDLHELDARRVHVAEPGAGAADPASGTEGGGALLCVAPVTFDKGHDVLLDALASIRAASWQCVCVGRLDRDPAFVQALRRRSIDLGLGDRVSFTGPRAGADLDRLYGGADLLALASRSETYGMVITEALARGLPVVAADVGGVPEALGHGADGIPPGLLVPPDNPDALAEALRLWLGDHELRARLRRAALERRESLSPWSATASIVAGVLSEVTR